ncbi:hypothetical protein J6590_038648 [Homalodisca vitripennis]|nr:hypothetical protein J6590_038648 [Homalodisca vitripennis]
MHGARRVIAFCLMTAVLPTILLIIPLYLRHSVYTDTIYAVAESDVVEMGNGNGISTVFCQDAQGRQVEEQVNETKLDKWCPLPLPWNVGHFKTLPSQPH